MSSRLILCLISTLFLFSSCKSRGFNSEAKLKSGKTWKFGDKIQTGGSPTLLFHWTHSKITKDNVKKFVTDSITYAKPINEKATEIKTGSLAGEGMYLASDPFSSLQYGTTLIVVSVKPNVDFVVSSTYEKTHMLETIRSDAKGIVYNFESFLNENGKSFANVALVLRDISSVDIESVQFANGFPNVASCNYLDASYKNIVVDPTNWFRTLSSNIQTLCAFQKFGFPMSFFTGSFQNRSELGVLFLMLGNIGPTLPKDALATAGKGLCSDGVPPSICLRQVSDELTMGYMIPDLPADAAKISATKKILQVAGLATLVSDPKTFAELGRELIEILKKTQPEKFAQASKFIAMITSVNDGILPASLKNWDVRQQ